MALRGEDSEERQLLVSPPPCGTTGRPATIVNIVPSTSTTSFVSSNCECGDGGARRKSSTNTCSVTLTDDASSGFVSQFSLEEEDVGARVQLREASASDGDSSLPESVRHRMRYLELLRRAREEDLSQLEETECLYRAKCRDKQGREVVVLIGKWFKLSQINLDKALLYLIKVLDEAVDNNYVVVYFHTRTNRENMPYLWWIREAYAALTYKYKKNLKAFYVVHPTVWSRMTCWWVSTLVTPAVKNKIHNVHSLKELEAVVDVKALSIPMFITEQDMVFNGLRFYQP